MKLEEFDAFVVAVLSTMEGYEDEYYGTPHDICEGFLESARRNLFIDEIERQEEYKKYLELKAKFEPETPNGVKFQPGE